MPSRNAIKSYVENSYYHIYNRGVEKRDIFLDNQDWRVFLSYLKEYLSVKDEAHLLKQLASPTITYGEKNHLLKLLRLNNFYKEITLVAYSLMPNHFHFLIKQNSAGSIDKFMNSLGTRYTMYFNRRHDRVGSLYQGVYKAVLVSSEEQLLYLTYYIHSQALPKGVPKGVPKGETFRAYPSSHQEYVGERKTEWVNPTEILAYFSNTNPQLSYSSFMALEGSPHIIQDVSIEDI